MSTAQMVGWFIVVLLAGGSALGIIIAVFTDRAINHVIATTRRCHHCGRTGRHGYTRDGKRGWICTYGPPCARRYLNRRHTIV